uniref:ATP synthase F0 subunit 8 n=1 Tax=Lycosa singoriensis TaxID=434756 RepID=UPI002176C32E|nr:ATP synthase F0 subunit 8 [Lycosa singoriensis]UUC05153.1 ATP synthase F0 subunit 8 [Lycosa singoriensis]
MPQLMPFYWVNSVFMVFFMMITLIFFYFYKALEEMNSFDQSKHGIIMFNFMW